MAKADHIEAVSGEPPEAADPLQVPGRQRAAIYLDLWERHLVLCALHGPAPVPRAGRTRA